MCPLSPGPCGGNGFLKRASLAFTLVRNLGEVCRFSILSECLLCVCGTHADQVFGGFRHLEGHTLIRIYTLPLTNIFLSVALLASV